MVKFLLDAGADQEHKTDEMHTALMEASMVMCSCVCVCVCVCVVVVCIVCMCACVHVCDV